MRVVFALVVSTFAILATGFQVPGVAVIGSGDFVPGVNPPTGIGNCWNGLMITPKAVVDGQQCDNFILCQPLVNCAAAPNPSPGGCQFRKTHDYRLVGTCILQTNSQCTTCAGGSQIFCMSYKYFQGKLAGACVNPCGEWQVFFAGECLQ